MFGLSRLFSITTNATRPIQARLFTPATSSSSSSPLVSFVNSTWFSQFRSKHYKLKTHQGCAKRFKKTATGFKRGQCGRNHLNNILNSDRRGRLRGTVPTTSNQSKLLAKMIRS